ncbi:inner membrane protein YhjD [Mycolicibacillus trivialis]
MSEASKPGLLERLRERYRWLDRVLRAQQRYTECQGNFYAAGLTYFTIFALFPILMVAFAAGGFLLASRPDLLGTIEEHIRSSVSGKFGEQLIDLMDVAIDSRASVGIIGLAVAAWAGLSWMDKLREALSQMWEQRVELPGFVKRKLSDLIAMLSAFVAMALTLALTALGDPGLMAAVLRWVGIPHVSALGGVLRAASLLVSLLVSWMLFTWMIARLPRESVSFVSSLRAGLLAAVGFEVFKQFASIYLKSVLNSPAGATFGPVLGLMVFAYVTARLVLFATAWAATSEENLLAAPVLPPNPVVISPRAQPRPELRAWQAVSAAAAGGIGALGLSRALRRR